MAFVRGVWRSSSQHAGACYTRGMQAVASKQRILDALNDLAENASIDDAIERL
jgi:hypothetical protein